jgi:ribosomal protein L2
MFIKFKKQEKRIEFIGFNNIDSVTVEGNDIPLLDGNGFWCNQNEIQIGDIIKLQLISNGEIVREIEIKVQESTEI